MPIPTNPVILSSDSFSFITGADNSVMRERLGVATYSTTYYVKTWAQLQTALANCGTNGGGIIYIDGTIVIPPHATSGFTGNGGLNITVPNVIITGYPNGKSVLKLQAGATYTYQILSVININASNVTIENITIEGTIVYYSFNGTTSRKMPTGIHIGRGPTNLGISHLTFRNNHFFNNSYAIFQTGGPGSPINRNTIITGNKITSCGGGVYISYSLDGLLISENSIIGDGAVYDGTKFSVDNCIWVGLGIARCRIVNNYCADHQRMGIEVFLPYKNTSDVNDPGVLLSRGESDVGIVVANNTVTSMGSMGISFTCARNSIVANNTISDTVFVGLEIVGDDKNLTTQKPDRVVNATVIGNSVRNVRATPRRKKATAPTSTWLYGYSPMELDPTNCVLPAQSFSNRVPLNETAQFGINSYTFTYTTPRSYPEFAQGKQALLRRADGQYMIGTVTSNTNTTIVINVTSISAGPSGSLFTYTLCPYGQHTISVPPLQLDWSGNNASMNSLSGSAEVKGTGILLRHPHPTAANIYMNASVLSYTPGATTAVINIGFTGAAFDQNTSWVAMASQMLVGLSIDQIYGCKAIGNTVDIVLDSSSSIKVGCQIQYSRDITFEGNTLARAGQRYLNLLNSNRVFMRGNTFKAGTESMVREVSSFNITKLGEDILFPENIVSLNQAAQPCSFYAQFDASAIDYNPLSAYNNCRYIFKDNTVIPTYNNQLKTLVNNCAVFSDQYSRPETAFGPAVVLKNNWVGEGFADLVNWPIPVLDYSQKWSNVGQTFTGYRFHIDTFQSKPDSRIFDIATGDTTYLYLRSYASSSSNDLTLGSKTFVSTTPSFTLANVPAGTFVRCENTADTAFVEGRVTSFSAAASSVTILATYSEGTPATYTAWNIVFDTSALFVDKTSQLNLRSNVVLDYHTGTKFGTSSAQKLGFWNKTPVIQPAAVTKASDLNTAIAQLNTLIDRLSSIGILAS